MSALIINDPVYGFTSVPRGLLTLLIAHRYFQRLGRIRQLGMGSFVYPGALHTRAAHSLGAFHLMQEALLTLQQKGTFLFDSEVEAAEAAILLHDVGHGPFSHVLERTLVDGVSHEQLSLLMMQRLNREFRGDLTLAINIFTDTSSRPFLHELLSSQLDADRLDYLCRDSFYCGVREGNIGASRLIKMLRVQDEQLMIDIKGLYTVENYLMARRLMYWQVYLHKTVVAAEEVLRQTLRRAKYLLSQGESLAATPTFLFFLTHQCSCADFERDEALLDAYAELDDSDVIASLKMWQKSKDRILSRLAQDYVQRHLFKVTVSAEKPAEESLAALRRSTAEALGIDEADADYFVTCRRVNSRIYSPESENIWLWEDADHVHELATVSHVVRDDTPSDEKYYTFVQR